MIATQPHCGFSMTRWPDHPMTRLVYLAVIPLGPAGLFTVIGLLIDPLIVLTEKPEMLLALIFDV
jgi:hypothetical protein